MITLTESKYQVITQLLMNKQLLKALSELKTISEEHLIYQEEVDYLHTKYVELLRTMVISNQTASAEQDYFKLLSDTQDFTDKLFHQLFVPTFAAQQEASEKPINELHSLFFKSFSVYEQECTELFKEEEVKKGTLSEEQLCTLVAGFTLSLSVNFDAKKLEALVDIATQNVVLKAKCYAAIGIIFSLQWHLDRILHSTLLPKIKQWGQQHTDLLHLIEYQFNFTRATTTFFATSDINLNHIFDNISKTFQEKFKNASTEMPSLENEEDNTLQQDDAITAEDFEIDIDGEIGYVNADEDSSTKNMDEPKKINPLQILPMEALSAFQEQLKVLHKYIKAGVDISYNQFSFLFDKIPYFDLPQHWILPYFLKDYSEQIPVKSRNTYFSLTENSLNNVTHKALTLFLLIGKLKQIPEEQTPQISMYATYNEKMANNEFAQKKLTLFMIKNMIEDYYRFFTLYSQKYYYQNPFDHIFVAHQTQIWDNFPDHSLVPLFNNFCELEMWNEAYEIYPLLTQSDRATEQLLKENAIQPIYIARTLSHQHQYEKALPFFLIAIQSNNHLQYNIEWAEAAIAAQHFQEAHHELQQLYDKNKSHTHLAYLLGLCLHKMGKNEEAIQFLSEVNYFSPQKELQLLLAEILLTTGDHQHALSTIQQISPTTSFSAQEYLLLSVIAICNHQPAIAIQYLQKFAHQENRPVEEELFNSKHLLLTSYGINNDLIRMLCDTVNLSK